MKRLLLLAILGCLVGPNPCPANDWQSEARLGFNQATGNTERLDLGVEGKSIYTGKENYEFSVNGNYDIGRNQGIEDRKNFNFIVNADQNSNGTISPFGFLQYEKKRYSGIDNRIKLGAGYKYTYFGLKDKGIEPSISLATIYMREDSKDKTKRRLVLSYRPKIKYQRDNFTVEWMTFYQPKIFHSSEYLIDTELAAKVKVNKNVDLGVCYKSEYNSRPPQGKKNNDGTIITSIGVRF